MASYKLAPLADADLVNIANKTIDDWGYKQAKVYLQAIDTALNKLAQTPAGQKPNFYIMCRCQLDSIFINVVAVVVNVSHYCSA